MNQRYPIPEGQYRVEEEVRRSRFITTVAHTPTVEAARDFITSMQVEFADASHNCWAYVVGPPSSTANIGMSDDGEPHGTAGRPMFTVLQHSGIGDICAVVTRYFGGTLLGKGGLVKSYGGGVQRAVEALPLGEHVPSTEMLVVVDYRSIKPMQRLLPDFEVTILDEEYAVDVTYHLKLPLEQVDGLTSAITEMTKGQALIEITTTQRD